MFTSNTNTKHNTKLSKVFFVSRNNDAASWCLLASWLQGNPFNPSKPLYCVKSHVKFLLPGAHQLVQCCLEGCWCFYLIDTLSNSERVPWPNACRGKGKNAYLINWQILKYSIYFQGFNPICPAAWCFHRKSFGKDSWKRQTRLYIFPLLSWVWFCSSLRRDLDLSQTPAGYWA